MTPGRFGSSGSEEARFFTIQIYRRRSYEYSVLLGIYYQKRKKHIII